jgi:hypothetical protein
MQSVLTKNQYSCFKEFDLRRREEEETNSDDESETKGDIRTGDLTLYWDHEKLGVVGTSFPRVERWENVAMFVDPSTSGFGKCVFTKVPSKSRLFIYRLTCTKTKGTLFGNSVLRVDTTSIKPKELDFELLSLILTELGIQWSDKPNTPYYDFFTSDEWNKDPLFKPPHGKNYYVYDKLKVEELIPWSCQALFYLHADIKRFFLFDSITFLKKGFPEECILGMEWDDIRLLEQIMRKTPHDMCYPYNGKTGKEFRYKDKTSTTDSATMILPELPYKNLLDIIGEIDVEDYPRMEVVAACFYDQLKIETFKNKHVFTMIDAVFKRVETRLSDMFEDDEEKVFSPSMKEDVIERLCTSSAVVVDEEGRVYMRNQYLSELCIDTAMKLMFEREYFNSISMGYDQCMEDYDGEEMEDREGQMWTEETMKEEEIFSHRGNVMCDEQKRALKLFRKVPFMIVNGPGGSGKTEFLGVVAREYQQKNMLAVAFQASNASDLSCMFQRSSTIHMALCTHRYTCMESNNPFSFLATENSSPVQQKKLKKMFNIPEDHEKKFVNKLGIGYNKCMLEDVELLVVDEGSLVYHDIFAELFVSLMCCGKLKKVIMVGDVGQLPPIKAGKMFEKMFKALDKMGCAISFTHNHRVDKGSKILKINAEFIKHGQGDLVQFDAETSILYAFEPPPEMDNSLKLRMLAGLVLRALKEFSIGEYEHHIVTPTNEVKRYLLPIIEKHFHDLEYGNRADYNPSALWKGRKVMFKMNNYELGAINNEMLVIKSIEDRGPFDRIQLLSTAAPPINKELKRFIVCEVIDSPTKVIKEFEFNKWVRRWLKKACVTTVDGFQGKQKSTVIGVVNYYSSFITRERMYTLFTRMSKRSILVAPPSLLTRASLNPEPIRRSILDANIVDLCKKFSDTIIEI